MGSAYDFSQWEVAPTYTQSLLPEEMETREIGESGQSGSQVQILSREVEAILAFGESHGWNFTYLGQAPYPTRTVRLQNWKIVPAHQDPTELPRKAMRRLQRLEEAGIRFRGYLIAHEIETYIPEPQVKEPGVKGRQLEAVQTVGSSVLKAGETVLPVILGGVVLVGGVLASLAVAAVSATLAGLAAIDPILIACSKETSKGESAWIEIYRWNE